ncbi:MAG: histidine--tRNA ligase [Acidobacteria bacterium]|nr:MAG: histidine--tRNA ligase [Acidobacteriota bacterium]
MEVVLKAPKGTRDLLPELTRIFQVIESRAQSHFAKYGFEEIRTPMFEETALFKRGIGDETDIVSKEMYTFVDKGGREMTLRPELTASVCRSVIQHNLTRGGDLVKLMYMGPMFRYERPQAGRYRQFSQLGVEVFGSQDPMIDVETIEALMSYLEPFELPHVKLVINSIGDERDRPAYLSYLRGELQLKQGKMCAKCKVRMEKNVLRVLDCKNPHCQEELKDLASISEFLNEENRAHFAEVQAGLSSLGVDFEVNPFLVRGLDYYTKTAFELLSGDLGAQSAIMGGGRYDGLLKSLGGPDVPAFGWALGMDRLVSVLEKYQRFQKPAPDLFFVFGNRDFLVNHMKTMTELRNRGYHVGYDIRCGSMKSQMKKANKSGAAMVALVGEDEAARNEVLMKNMRNSQQNTVSVDQIANQIQTVSRVEEKT